MFLRLLKNSFKRQPRRKVLAACAVSLGTAVATALVGVSLSVGDKVNRELKAYGANFVMIPKSDAIPLEIGGLDLSALTGGGFLSEKDLPLIKDVFWRNNIIAFSPVLPVRVQVKGHDAVLTGTWFSQSLRLSDGTTFRTGIKHVNRYWKVEGHWVHDQRNPSTSSGQAPDGCLIGRRAARRFGLKIGDQLEAHYGECTLRLHILGIVTTGGAEEEQIFAPLKAVQKLTGLQGKIKRVLITALTTPESTLFEKYRLDPTKLSPQEYDRWYCTPYPSSIAHQLSEAIPGSEVKVIRQAAESEGRVLSRLSGLMLLVTLAALLTAALGMMSTMTTTVIERQREVALMKAIGASDAAVALLFFSEATLVGLVGGAIGCGGGILLGDAISQSVFGSSLDLNPLLLLAALVLAVAIAILGSIFPVSRALRIEPAVVLRGE